MRETSIFVTRRRVRLVACHVGVVGVWATSAPEMAFVVTIAILRAHYSHWLEVGPTHSARAAQG
jgi:hypothetical protein